jgi:hypothetical protein
MSSNRTRYDDCAYDLEVKRSREQGAYRLFAEGAEHCQQCLNVDGVIGRSGCSTAKQPLDLRWGEMADTESALSWRNHQLNKCNDPATNYTKHSLNHKPTCSTKLVPEDTRFTHPLDDYRCMSLTEHQILPYLPVNPQCVIQEDRLGLDTKLIAKDHYRMPKQTFWDNGSALPKPTAMVEQAGHWVFVLDQPKLIQ